MKSREYKYHNRIYKAYGYRFHLALRLGIIGFDESGKTNFSITIPKNIHREIDGSLPELNPIVKTEWLTT